MNMYQTALDYFKELCCIPRMPLHEEKIRHWIIKWAEERKYSHTTDAIGNLLIVAPGNKNTILCLQAHMDMVCVADGQHNFATHGISITEQDGKITAQKTSLGADNGIGVATMMTLTELTDRPTLELLFTMGEEVGLVGAQHITLPLSAPYALNLDWSDSDTIGIGCGGTLLMAGEQDLIDIPHQAYKNNENIYTITLRGMQGGHSGEDIRYYRGNAISEILRVIQELPSITHIGDILGGEADNVIPHSSKMNIVYLDHPNLLINELSHLQKILRTKYKHDTISLSAEKIDTSTALYKREDILPRISQIIELGTGVQVWGKNNTPLSSWNLGIFSLEKNILKASYFLRSNLEGGIDEMEQELLKQDRIQWSREHASPPWESPETDILTKHIQESFVDKEGAPLETIRTHATVECGLLSEKYPETTWISVGVTIHNMHTVNEYIEIRDLEKFVERMENFLQR